MASPAIAENRLAESNSPYLLLHADNPVDWYPWGPDAFKAARETGKPIFLSVGYSTCYWCHVAERTLYSDPEIAELMNKWFVNVKVDREQRPAVDNLYMTARHLLSDDGGWPNNVFLTPDLKPFFAGSYWPPESRRGRPGFPEILDRIQTAWSESRRGVVQRSERVIQAMQKVRARQAGTGETEPQPSRWLAGFRESTAQRLDERHGGLASSRSRQGPKFPNEPALSLLLTDYKETGNTESLRALRDTLNAMAYGGIRDHLAGGFHRYTTERTWTVPHFEKMLYTNAQLLSLYARAHGETEDPLYRRIAARTAGYLLARMQDEDGGFFTAKDAQVDEVEGASYLWTRDQIEAALGKKRASRFFEVYALKTLPDTTPPGMEEPEGDVLRLRESAASVAQARERDVNAELAEAEGGLDEIRAELLARRDQREQPAIDKKLVTNLNGLAIEALARAAGPLEAPRFLEAARAAAERIWMEAFDRESGALKRRIYNGAAELPGHLSDYAHFANGLIALADATGERQWREQAERLADAMIGRFRQEDGGFAVSPEIAELPLAPLGKGDTDQPSGTSSALKLLLRLDGERYEEAAAGLAESIAPRVDEAAEAWPLAIEALIRFGEKSITVASSDPGEGQGASEQATRAQRATQDGGAVPESADQVEVSAEASRGSKDVAALITLRVKEPYHVNANPASRDFLIPTEVSFEGAEPRKVNYPAARRFAPEFAEDGPIDVYAGRVLIAATLPPAAGENGRLEGTLRVQACDEETCLPPSDIAFTAPLEEGG